MNHSALTATYQKAVVVSKVKTPLLDVAQPIPTDPVNFVGRGLTPELVRIIECGPCQPGLNSQFSFPRTEGRAFRPAWYTRTTGSLKASRDWLIYSPAKDCMFCFACWLFSDRTDPHYDPAWAEPTHGVAKWKKATGRISTHEQASIHTRAVGKLMMTRYCIRTGKTVNQKQLRASQRVIGKNRDVLRRLPDITLFLSKQNLAFRGHREYSGKGSIGSNEGNFLEIVKLLSKYDAVLANHLQHSKKMKHTSAILFKMTSLRHCDARLRQRYWMK